MKNSAQGTDGAAQASGANQLPTISERKLKANRENAKKSTGPRTARGKANSRQNAVKHGLLVNKLAEVKIRNEDPRELSRLHARLQDDLRPVGFPEELEVEHIAVCHWKLMRAWRYENAEIRLGQEKVSNQASEDWCLNPDSKWPLKSKAIKSMLESAKKEIESTGVVSQEVKNKVSSCCQEELKNATECASLQEIAEQIAKERGLALNQAKQFLRRDPWSQPEYARSITLEAIGFALNELLVRGHELTEQIVDAQFGQLSIPQSNAMDTIIRYEAAIQRSLNRAYDRLDHLQRRRLAVTHLPPAQKHMTQ
jgi:hypothetical protein